MSEVGDAHLIRPSSRVCAVVHGQVEMQDGVVDEDVLSGLWLANHDADGTIAADAADAWRTGGYCLPESTCAFLLAPLSAVDETVRQSGAKALAGALVAREDAIEEVCTMLREEFQQALVVPEPVRDHLGNTIRHAHRTRLTADFHFVALRCACFKCLM